MTTEVVIFGAGSAGRSVRNALASRGIHARAFCDNDPGKYGSYVAGTPIIAPAALAGLPGVPIVIASVHQDDIQRQLAAMGYSGVPSQQLLSELSGGSDEPTLSRIGKLEHELHLPAYMF